MDKILETLEQDMALFSIGRVSPLACDKWIASSAMQKSIRRGNVKLALRAGFTLWQQDRASFWRRVHIIALEDVGVSAPDMVVKVLTAYDNSAWRVKRNDLLVGLYLITLLCGAVKTRVADEVIAIIGNGLDLKRKREEFFFADESVLAGVVLDKTQSLPERALALWLLAGTDIYPHDNLPTRKGNIALAMDVLNHLSSHTELTKASFAVIRKTQWTLALLTPLLYQTITEPLQTEQTTIILDDVSNMDDVKGIPLVALDQFTRVGKAVIRDLQSRVPALKPFSTKQIGTGIFYTESERVDRRLSSPMLDALRQQAGVADFEGSFGDAPSYFGLCEILAEQNDLLQSLRKRHLKDYLKAQSDELQFGEAG